MPTRFASTAVVGAGAVGGFFGAMLARSGHPVTLIARPAQVLSVREHGLRLERGGRVEAIAVDAGTDIAAVRNADLVLMCVKSGDTDAVAREMAPHLREGALVLSLQNGVDNATTIARHLRGAGQRVVPAVVYVATAMPEPGLVRHFGRGDLVIGPLVGAATAAADSGLAEALRSLAELFAVAGVPVRIADDVRGELWSKLMVNCAYNAISALAQTSYSRLAALPEVRELQLAVVREVVAVAQAEGVALALDAAIDSMERIALAMPDQLSSTAQDLARGKPTEIHHLNGFVARRGSELGVPTPANQALHALVRLVESGRGGG